MKKLLLVVIAVFVLNGVASAKGAHAVGKGGKVHVKQYTKKNGKVVKSHARTAPNKTERDNWSTKGNVNPENGEPGKKTPTK